MKLKLIVTQPNISLVHVCNEIGPGVWRVAETLIGDNWDSLQQFLLERGHYKSVVEALRQPLSIGEIL